jgi:hypothetical protein
MRPALLDEQLPRALARELGSGVETVQDRGWAGLKNGDLLKAAAAAGFEVLITMDRNLRFQQNLQLQSVGVVLLRVRTNRLADLLPLIPATLAAIAAVAPGSIVEVGA